MTRRYRYVGMKCPKCGNESVNSVGIEGPLEAWECLQCSTVWFMGHEEKVGGKCQTCGKELPEPQMNLCSDCFDKNGHTKGVRITKKVGGEKHE